MNFLNIFLKNTQIQLPWKFIEKELSCSVRMDRQRDMKTLTVAFCTFSKHAYKLKIFTVSEGVGQLTHNFASLSNRTYVQNVSRTYHKTVQATGLSWNFIMLMTITKIFHKSSSFVKLDKNIITLHFYINLYTMVLSKSWLDLPNNADMQGQIVWNHRLKTAV